MQQMTSKDFYKTQSFNFFQALADDWSEEEDAVEYLSDG
jgi:capsule polysaccharide export protein KpsE/RkpR